MRSMGPTQIRGVRRVIGSFMGPRKAVTYGIYQEIRQEALLEIDRALHNADNPALLEVLLDTNNEIEISASGAAR